MAAEAFDSNLTVPAGFDDLRQSVGIVLVGFVNLAAHCRLGMPSIKTYHRKAHVLQRVPVPRRQGTAFQSDPRNLRRLGFDDLCETGFAPLCGAPRRRSRLRQGGILGREKRVALGCDLTASVKFPRL